jgi:hypothetical protein
VDAEAANIDVMNAIQAQNQIAERRDQLFNHDVIVKQSCSE